MKEGKSTAAHAQIWDQPVPLQFHICSEVEERQHLSRQPQFYCLPVSGTTFSLLKRAVRQTGISLLAVSKLARSFKYG